MVYKKFEIPDEFRDIIHCFWYTKRDGGDEPSDFDVQPDGYVEIIFYIGSLYSIYYQGGKQPLPSPFLMGLLNQPVIFQTQNMLEVIGIRFYPWTVHDWLGLPVVKEGLRIFEHPIAGLQFTLHKLVNEGKLEDAITVLKNYFLGMPLQVSTDVVVLKAGNAIRQANGGLRVSQVAVAAHATVRTLERKFKQSAGYSVKDVTSLMRFEQVRNHLWCNPNVSIAGLAHELGYTDQSHLSRDFKRYTGSSPASFARKIKKGKLVAGDNFVAFIQA